MRRPLVAGNWKMHTSYSEAEELAAGIRDRARAVPVEVVLCPPFPWLELVRRVVAGTDLRVGAQDTYWEASGAYTGEVSPTQLRDLCDYVIVGHSERRALFGESDEVAARKFKAAIGAGLTPILAVGESSEEFEAGRTEEAIRRQLSPALDEPLEGRFVMAYEPVWAIGREVPAPPEHAGSVAALVRGELERRGHDAANTQILYGGSVGVTSFPEFLAQPDLDGALVGRVSLDPEQFSELVQMAALSEY